MMRRIIVWMSLILVVILIPFAQAQGDLTQQYTSSNGSLTFSYPEGWIVAEIQGLVVVGTSQAAIDATNNFEVLNPNELAIFILPFLAEDAGSSGVSVDASPLEALSSLVDNDTTVTSNIETTSVGGVPIAYVTFPEREASAQTNFAAVRALETGEFLLFSGKISPESLESATPTLLAILASVQTPALLNPTPQPTVEPSRGDKILYTQGNNLYIANADGSDARTFFETPPVGVFRMQTPAWSPDGTQIAFTVVYSAREFDVYRVAANGTHLVQLTDTRDASQPSWSADGSQIIFTRGYDELYRSETSREATLWIANADGSNATRFLSNMTGFLPAWSPDGTRIAFTSVQDGDRDIYVVNADGSNLVNLTNANQQEDYDPAWSPDGTQIAYNQQVGNDYGIALINADGSNPRPAVTENNRGYFNPAWSADGTLLLFEKSGGIVTLSGTTITLLVPLTNSLPPRSVAW